MPRVKGAVLPTELKMLTKLTKPGVAVSVTDLGELVDYVSKYVVYLKLHWGYDVQSNKVGRNVVSYELVSVPANHDFLLDCATKAEAGQSVPKISHTKFGVKAGSPGANAVVNKTKPVKAKAKAKSKAAKPKTKITKPMVKAEFTSNEADNFVDPDFDELGINVDRLVG